jgi:hypothetical protein
MSTDPYPEVTGDESGIVPSQSGRSPEWPKKLRTLSAVELDRLTIDGNGRFYWDGRLVNYEPPREKAANEREQSAMEVIDRAVEDLGDQKHAEPIEGAELEHLHEAPVHAHREEEPAVDFDMVRPVPETAVVHHTHLAAETPIATHVIQANDVVRLKLSRWQSLGAILLVLGVLVGASGMAAYGFVSAHDWGCRAGLIHDYCQGIPGSRPSSRSDIPA